MTIVIDANILIAFALTDEPLHIQASQVLLGWQAASTQLAAPRLFRSEVTAVMRKAVYQQRIAHDQGRSLLARRLVDPIEFYEDDDLLASAYELAQRFKRPRAYDSQYMALAERLNSEFWTADETLYNSIQSKFSPIRWLGTLSQLLK